MIQIQNKIDKAFGDLEFEPGRHIYKVLGKVYPSTSSKIKKHTEPFNAVKWSKIIARKRGRTPQEIMTEWDNKRDKAAEKGTRVHDYAEKWWDNKLREPLCDQEKAAKTFLEFVDSHSDLEVVACELQMYSKAFGYAGTTDLVLRRKSTGKIIIVDYKTNENLDKTYQYLLPPFHFLPNNPYNKYQLQLSYYQIMLEEAGLEVEERWVIWLMNDGSFEIRKTEDYTKQLIDYMNDDY